jgi:hypothetical protein
MDVEEVLVVSLHVFLLDFLDDDAVEGGNAAIHV